MKRPYLPKEAKKLISKHENIIEELMKLPHLLEVYQKDIEDAAELLAAEEVMNILKDIPVEELSRKRRGIRIKSLKDRGYTDIASIVAASLYQIKRIRGISREAAELIKQDVDEMAKQARQSIRITLSEDHKTKASSKLILSAMQYDCLRDCVEEADTLLSNYKNQIGEDIEDLNSGIQNGFLWFFSSRDNQQKAINAYKRLTCEEIQNYLIRAREILKKVNDDKDLKPKDAWKDFSKNPVKYINVLEEVIPDLFGNDNSEYGLPEDLAAEIRDQAFFPKGLKCQLRPYQVWGIKYILHQGRVLLGDEMGLGKTIQAIATMVSLKNTGATHFLVVCPASVITNWCREIKQHSLLSYMKIYGRDRLEAIEDWKHMGGVGVTTYETTAFFDLEDEFRFSMLTVDEAHYIKNVDTKRSQNVRRLCGHADRLLFMTGTPLENNVDEMISLIDVLQPMVATGVHGLEALASAPQFKEIVAPVYYRRKREDVAKELPPKVESREWLTLGEEEEAIYEEAVLNKKYAQARRLSWSVDDMSKSVKANRLKEIVEEAVSEKRKVIVFSFFLDTIKKVTKIFGDQCLGPINGSISPEKRQQIIDDFDKAGPGTVLASQILSGGTGLNIQSASVVVICEPQFKPSTENQAISRAYRMGQTKDVLVYRLLCENTVDEKITEVLDQKQEIFDAFADESIAAKEEQLEVDSKTFGTIIDEEIDRINRKNHTLN